MDKRASMKNSILAASTTSSAFYSSLDYNEIKLSLTSGIIAHINTQLCASFADFYGFLIGRYKLIKNMKSIDSNSNFQENTLTLTIDSVIFIYDKNYLKDKLDKLLEKIEKKYTIIGLFSARCYSFPNISLKEQEFYFRTMNYLKKDKRAPGLPLLFGCFCHNLSEQNLENSVNKVNFYSRIYKYNESKNEFVTLPYDIINMKDTSYVNQLNLNATKSIESKDAVAMDGVVNTLKSKVIEHINLIESKMQNELKELKTQLKVELETNKKLYEKLRAYET